MHARSTHVPLFGDSLVPLALVSLVLVSLGVTGTRPSRAAVNIIASDGHQPLRVLS